jgi:organic hydroperoxide reductase OsmC/OhrA
VARLDGGRLRRVRPPPSGDVAAGTGLPRALERPGLRGDPALLNPEQLLVMAAASCQLLSFLAVAARARIDVVDYEDHAEGEMPEADRPIRITRITLRPRITARGAVDDERIHHLVEVAHRECFISSSLNTEVVVEPEVMRA